jgi:hypothetical protein
MPYVLEGDRLRNLYNLRIQNKEPLDRTYRIEFQAMEGNADGLEVLIPQPQLNIAGLGDSQVPIFLYVPRDAYEGSFPVTFAVTDSATGRVLTAETKFLGP